MEISRNEDGSFAISGMEEPMSDFMRAIVPSCNPGENAEALERLFPPPLNSGADDGSNEEWREYVQPELAHLFATAAEVVRGDLEQLDGDPPLVIPARHVDAWLNTLNQARLVLAARYAITEAEMEEPISPVLENQREIALFQIHFYGFLQECLIRGE